MHTKTGIFLIAGMMCAGGVLTQAARAQTGGTAAYVYVAEASGIVAYEAGANGKLTAVPGSPFDFPNQAKLSVTKTFLFAENEDGNAITTFAIGSNGSLKKVSSVNPYNWEPGSGCVAYPDIQVDFQKSTLYHQENQCNANSAYLSFHIEKNGALQYLGNSGGYIDSAEQGAMTKLSMAGTGNFAYDSYCGEDEGDLPVIDIYKRESNGNLDYVGQSNQVPAGGGGNGLCMGPIATDAANHLAAALQEIDSQDGDDGWTSGPYRLASYTEDANGNVTTSATWESMPVVAVADQYTVDAMSISPNNEFLAVGGPKGLEVFHFNGSGPITTFSSAIQPETEFVKLGWDKANHLYALGNSVLRVYTVTSSGVVEAPGSPYTLKNAGNVIVLDE